MSFGDRKKGFISGIMKIERSTYLSIHNVQYVNYLKYNLLCVSQIFDKRNEIRFMFEKCLVTNCVTHKVVTSATRAPPSCNRCRRPLRGLRQSLSIHNCILDRKIWKIYEFSIEVQLHFIYQKTKLT